MKPKQDKRIRTALELAPEDDWPTVNKQTQAKYCAYLNANLQLPCEVTGIEDFRWEEPYFFGGWDQKEYEKLKKTQPSCEDSYQLLSVVPKGDPQWMLCPYEDLAAQVKRIDDGKEFVLGLSELEAVKKKTHNGQLLEDYGYFFWNFR